MHLIEKYRSFGIWNCLRLMFKIDCCEAQNRAGYIGLCSYSVISSPVGNICRVVSTAISTTYWSHVHNTPDRAVQASAWLFTTSCILSVLLRSIYEMQSLFCLFCSGFTWFMWFWSRLRELSVQNVDDILLKSWKENHLTYLLLFYEP